MLFGNREPRSLAARRRGAFSPRGEDLENRTLMAVDLGGAVPPNIPNVAATPYGILEAGSLAQGGAGYSTAQVGDINLDGYHDVVIGAPTVTNGGNPLIGPLGPGTGTNSAAYLLYGSKQAGSTTNVDWATLPSGGTRVGDLGQLGNATQTNPISGTAAFGFDGIKFISSIQTTFTNGYQIGESVAGGGTINGQTAVLLGAPNAPSPAVTGSPNGLSDGTGRAYLIYGSGLDSTVLTTHQVDLDAPPSTVNVITFVNSRQRGANTGWSVGIVFNLLGDNQNDVVIGAPNATINGTAATGAVYVIPESSIPSTTSTIDLANIGQNGGLRGLLFAGAATGDKFGWSLADAGNLDGQLNGSTNLDDLIIGAPGAGGNTGEAFLVYANTNFSQFATSFVNTVTNFTTTYLPISQVGSTTKDSIVNAIPGAVFRGVNPGDFTGFSVSTAGDLAFTGFGNILIGSPGVQANRGAAVVIYSNPFLAPLGIYQLNYSTADPLPTEVNVPTNVIPAATYVGGTAGDEAGYSVSVVAPQLTSTVINGTAATDQTNGILIGAPGFSAGLGATYLIPGSQNSFPNSNTTFNGYFNNVGLFGLRTAQNSPVSGLLVQLSTTTATAGTPTNFGLSVAGRLNFPGRTKTLDNDLQGDLVVAAPGYSALSAASAAPLAGGAYAVEGTFLTSARTTALGNVLVSGGTAITNVGASLVTIRVLSNINDIPIFAPVTDIDTSRIYINGFLVPAAAVTNFQGINDVNSDGIQEALFQVPISDLHLPNGTSPSTSTVLAIGGFTKSGSTNNSNNFWLGGGSNNSGGGGGVSTGSLTPIGAITQTSFIPHFGPDQYVPSLTALSALSTYKAIPLRVALHQYQAQPGFNARIQQFYHPVKHSTPQFGYAGNGGHNGRGHTTLGSKVFTRSKFHVGKTFTFTHNVHVVPTNEQTQHYGIISATPYHKLRIKK